MSRLILEEVTAVRPGTQGLIVEPAAQPPSLEESPVSITLLRPDGSARRAHGVWAAADGSLYYLELVNVEPFDVPVGTRVFLDEP